MRTSAARPTPFSCCTRAPSRRVLGYYTLCATALAPGEIPEAARKHVPRYPLVSATLIGRLAVSQARQGQGLGAILLADALRRAFDAAAGFYAAHGFVRLPDSFRLVLPMRLAEDAATL